MGDSGPSADGCDFAIVTCGQKGMRGRCEASCAVTASRRETNWGGGRTKVIGPRDGSALRTTRVKIFFYLGLRDKQKILFSPALRSPSVDRCEV